MTPFSGRAARAFVISFNYASAVCFLIAGSLKLMSSFHGAKILQTYNPIIPIKIKLLYALAGGTELALAAFLFCPAAIATKLATIIWFTGILAAYRFGLWYSGTEKSCPCLGYATEWFPWLHQNKDLAAKSVFVFLVVGATASVACQIFQGAMKKSSETPSKLNTGKD